MHQAKSTVILTVLLATSGLLVGTAGAATLTVDGDGSAMYSTIQDAIDAAVDGDVIDVAAGTYAETLQIEVAITLNGPNASISPNTGVRVPEAVIDPASGRGINVDNTNGIVVIDGLTINDTTDAAFWLVQRTGFAADVTIRNMVVSNVTYGVICADQGSSPFQPHANLTISDNLFENTLGANISALWLKSVTGALTVSGNVIDNTGYGGILLIDDFTGTAVIENNTISNTPQQGIQLAGVVNDAEVRNNTITSTNTIEDGDKGGIRIYGPEFTGTVNIHGNAISGSYNGIAVKDGMDVAGKDINIYDNDLAANSNLGLYHGGTGALNAELNWWGDATGPQVAATNPGGLGAGIGGASAGDVDYDPWWADMAMTIEGSNETVQNVTQGTTHSTIQAAVDAASTGDLIEVGPRTYAESINIGTSVTLASTDGAAATIIDGTGATVIDIAADDVTIDGFTITNPDGKRGVTAQNRNGVTFTNNVVTAIGTVDATTSGTNYGIAIVSGSAPVANVDILNNTFSDIVGGDFKSVDAIAVGWSNGDHDITDVLIENNTIDNLTTATVDYSSGGRGAYGVLVNHANPANAGRTVDLVIRNNTITNLEGLWVHGIGLEGDTPGALVEGNVLDTFIDHKDPSDAIGVFFEDNSYVATTTITHNSFTDISWGIAQHPTTATGAVDAPLNWYDTADPTAVAAQVFGDGIDYSPWLASGVDADGGTPGFQGDLSNLWVGAGGSIQEGIDAVVGSTVNVAAGTYDEGTIVIDRSLDLLGPNAGIATDATRNPEAIIANTRVTFANGTAGVVIDGFTFTGTPSGSAINAQNVSADDVAVRYNRFVDIAMTAVYTSNAANSHDGWVVSHNLFTNIGYAGDWNNLTFATASALNLWHSSDLTVTDNVIDGVAYNGLNLETVAGATVQDNIFRDIGKTGIQLANECVGPMSIADNLFERCNQRFPLDYNFWYGAIKWYASGDYLTATGDYTITGNVMDDCVVGYQFARPQPLTGGPAITFTGNTMSNNSFAGFLQYRAGGAPHDLANNSWNHETGPAFALFDYESWSTGEDPENYVSSNGGGQGDRVVLNATDPAAVTVAPWLGAATVTMVPAAEAINCTDNNTVTLTVQLTVDDFTPPVFGINAVLRAGSELTWSDPVSADPFGSTTQFLYEDEEDGSYTVSITTTGNPTQPIDAAGTYDLFTVTYTAASEGVADVAFDSFTMRDPSNAPIATSVGSAQITVDCTAPVVSSISAEPGHEKVEINWTHDGSPVDRFEVYRAVWYDSDADGSAYPEYDDLANDVVPARPLSHDAIDTSVWELVDGNVDAGATSLVDETMADGRGIYFYEVFAIDPATNASAPVVDNDEATNYWLGDFNGDGEVEPIGDITPLGDAFGTEEGESGYNNIIDIGPTDDSSSHGIPTTDSKIDFEDLMIAALNFGVVSPGKDLPNISETVDLVWTRLGASRWALHLEGGEGLQGVRVRAVVPAGTDLTLTAGELLGTQSANAFLRNAGDGLDVSLALLGNSESFTGTGELFVVDLSQTVEVNEIQIEARSVENGAMEVAFSQATAVEIPTVHSLAQNFPNPFNPQTTIKYALPTAADVQLKVYGVDGRLVKSLVNETREAGHHEVIWRGDDTAGRRVATGTYFYVIEAGDFHQVRKMTLVK